MQCPLCLGSGELSRAEILDRLGVKDFARVAQLSAEEAFRLLQKQHAHDNQNVWVRFESELVKRTSVLEQRHQDELRCIGGRVKELEAAAEVADQRNALDFQRERAELETKLRSEQSQRSDLTRRVEDTLREVALLRGRNLELEAQMAKVARIGKREELDFADEARAWPGVYLSDKLPKNGDFLLSFRDLSGAPVEPQILIDNKAKAAVGEGDLDKLILDAKCRSIRIAALVAQDESQLRQADKECRWSCKDGIWVLRTTRQWFRRDLDVLRPLFEQMRTNGADFLERNALMADEVRRTFSDLDQVEGELKKATKAITSASGLVVKYKGRLATLCDGSVHKAAPSQPPDKPAIA